MTIKDLYEEVKWLVAEGYGNYEVEIAKDVNDDNPTELEEGSFFTSERTHSVTVYGKES